MNSPTETLAAFTAWAKAHITGDEKGQAQIFLDHLFVAFGHPGSLDVGGEPEFRVRKATEDGGGTSFADYVWKPVVLIEMKKRSFVRVPMASTRGCAWITSQSSFAVVGVSTRRGESPWCAIMRRR